MIKRNLFLAIAVLNIGLTAHAMNKGIRNKAMNDEDLIISLPDPTTIKSALSLAGCAKIIDGIHRGLGNSTHSKEYLVSLVNERADEVPEGTGGLASHVTQEERNKILQVLFALNLNQQHEQHAKL